MYETELIGSAIFLAVSCLTFYGLLRYERRKNSVQKNY